MLKFQALISLVGLLSRTDRYEEAARILLASHDLVPSAEQAHKELRYLEVLSLLALLVQSTKVQILRAPPSRDCLSGRARQSCRGAGGAQCGCGARERASARGETHVRLALCVRICTFVLGKEQTSRNAAAVRASARRHVARHMSGYSLVSIATN